MKNTQDPDMTYIWFWMAGTLAILGILVILAIQFTYPTLVRDLIGG